MERRSNLLKIISKYKVRKQIKKLTEEVYEFIESVIDYEHSTKDNYELAKAHMTEEYADCMVLFNQFKLFYGLRNEDINDIIDFKIDRQLKRMEEEFCTKNSEV